MNSGFLLTYELWEKAAISHSTSIAPYSDAFIVRRYRADPHPIYDFLFTYYSFSPTKLKQWVPAYHQKLVFSPSLQEKYPWLNEYWFVLKENTLTHNFDRLTKNIVELADFIQTLCKNITAQPPRFSCFGLHEWAMVYKLAKEKKRHSSYPLRLSEQELNSFVEKQTLCCSHYDAFRFFTEQAKPLNIFKPTLDARLHMEQGGCVHANMDLYKWSSKLWPWIGSEFIAKTFFFALKARELDMRASPYDFTSLGFSPICIETDGGRKIYQKEQKNLAEEASVLRENLRNFCEDFLASVVGKKSHMDKIEKKMA